jgi:hypothetical protein
VAPLSTAEARNHLSKAEQFLRQAQNSLEDEDWDAAGSAAVLAGINAADSVSGMLQGNRWDGAHPQAAAHVRKAGEDGKAVAAQLTKLMAKKTQSQYESKPLRQDESSKLVRAAERAVVVARRVDLRQRAGRSGAR